MIVTAGLVLLVLHGPNGHAITLNPQQVTSLHAAVPGQKNQQISDAVKCLINTTDGKFVSVIETCDDVRRMIEGKP